jgi:hypothetical protein
VTKAATTRGAARPLIGWREWLALPGLGVPWIKAKVDTGARSSSLHAWDIEIDRGTGVIRFSVHPIQDRDDLVVSCQARLVEHRQVRSSNGELEERPIISTDAVVRGALIPLELSLTRRDEMGFRMLLGRAAIRRRFLVDPARSFLGGGDRVHDPAGHAWVATDPGP